MPKNFIAIAIGESELYLLLTVAVVAVVSLGIYGASLENKDKKEI